MKVFPFVVMFVALAVTPLSLRSFNNWVDASGKNVSYLPSYENRRARKGFRAGGIDALRALNPGWVFIGDSMLGTRIEPELLGEISGSHDRKVVLLMHAASGPAYWYLSFKNLLVASGVTPRMTFFFFRDTNLTDTMFRLQSTIGDALDEVAHAQEPELDAIVARRQRGGWSGIDAALNRLYEVDTAAAWLHPSVRRWYAFWKHPEVRARLSFEEGIEEDFNNNFRRDLAADIGESTDVGDFSQELPTSILPLIVQLSSDRGIPVCFVRVQRRPVGDKPPAQSPELLRYIADLRAWAESHGKCFYDETGDPELTLDLYEDGDHVRDRIAYTNVFRRRLNSQFE